MRRAHFSPERNLSVGTTGNERRSLSVTRFQVIDDCSASGEAGLFGGKFVFVRQLRAPRLNQLVFHVLFDGVKLQVPCAGPLINVIASPFAPGGAAEQESSKKQDGARSAWHP